MLQFDETAFPLVFIVEKAPGATTADQQLEQLLAREKAFILITDHRPDRNERHDQAERKARALFFKRIKAALRSYCRGIIFIENGSPLPLPVRIAAQTFGLAFKISVAFVDDEEAAISQGHAFLRT